MGQYESQRTKSEDGNSTKRLSSIAERALRETADLFKERPDAKAINLWARVLTGASDAAVVWAFENWNRNGLFFPKPVEILKLVASFGTTAENQAQLCGNCVNGWVVMNPETSVADQQWRRCECIAEIAAQGKVPVTPKIARSLHNRGYDFNDVRWLWKRFQQELAKNPQARVLDLIPELHRDRQGGVPLNGRESEKQYGKT